MRLLKRTASAMRSGSGKTDDAERRDSGAAASGEAVRMAGPREGRSAGCARKARARLGAAFSLVLAGTLAIGLCGGSPATIAALAAEGETEIGELRHLDRGYEGLEAGLSGLGAAICRIGG